MKVTKLPGEPTIIMPVTNLPEDYLTRFIETNTIIKQDANGNIRYRIEKEFYRITQCKDCKCTKNTVKPYEDKLYCSKYKIWVEPDGFCAWPEK